MKQHRHLRVTTAVGIALACASVAAAAAFGASMREHHYSNTARAAASVAGKFSALRDASLPVAPPAVTADFAAIHAGISPARQAGPGAYIANYNGAICVVISRGAGGCTNQLDHGVWLLGSMIRAFDSESAPFEVSLYGLAEDGVSSVNVALKDGGSRTIHVAHNAFRAVLPNTSFSDIAAMTVNSDTGQASLDPNRYFPASQSLRTQ